MLKENLVSYSINIQKFLGKLIIDLELSKQFFNNTELVLAESNLTTTEREFLMTNSNLVNGAMPRPEIESLWGS